MLPIPTLSEGYPKAYRASNLVGENRLHTRSAASSSRGEPEQRQVQRPRSTRWEGLPSSWPRDLHKASTAPSAGVHRTFVQILTRCATACIMFWPELPEFPTPRHPALQVKSSAGGSKQQDGIDWSKKQSASEWGEFLHCPGKGWPHSPFHSFTVHSPSRE